MSTLIEMVADFETTQIREYTTRKVYDSHHIKRDIRVLDNHKSKAFVCAWGLIGVMDDEDTIIHGRNIKDFLYYVKNLAETNPDNRYTIFTHNLGFDGSFVMYDIMRYWQEAFISDEVRDASLYSFSVAWGNDVRVTFRDSHKIFPMKVEELGELYGMAKLKGDWDYNKYRDDSTEITDEEWGYLDHDVIIVKRALKDYRERGYKENTIASIAYADRLRRTFPKFKKFIANRMKKKNYEGFRAAFPQDVMPLARDQHRNVMKAYFGGWTWLNPHYCPAELRKIGIADGKVRNVHSFDENSMYPDKMANWWLPIKQPIVYKNPNSYTVKKCKASYKCLIYHISHLTISLKGEYNFPMLMFPTCPETSVRCQGKVIMCNDEDVWLSNLDVEMMKAEYDIKSFIIEEIYCFNAKKGPYKKFVDYWMGVKAEATIKRAECKKAGDKAGYIYWSQQRAIAKVMMNSSYGKDGTKLFRDKKITSLVDGLLETSANIEETTIEFYMPAAVFITASARYDLYQLLKAAGREGIYSDTDSLKATEKGTALIYNAAKEGKLRIDDAELGAWKDEATYTEAKFVRQKTYAALENGEWHYTVCGAPDGVKALMDIEHFERGMIITLDMIHSVKDEKGNPLQGKLVPASVTGGVILVEVPFQISDYEEWEYGDKDNLPIEMFVDFMHNLKGVA